MEDTLALIEKEIPRLRRYARYLVRDGSQADDLVQETLARAIEKLHTWQTGTNMRAWLFVIMRNSFISEGRKEQRRPVTSILRDDHPVFAVAGGEETHVAFMDVQKAFESLPGDHRDVLLLVVIEGLKYEEAAAILNVPIGTVRSRVARARMALRDLLQGREDSKVKVLP
jgi:RNA polymerase sigma-70 factor (ECF subfamily)